MFAKGFVCVCVPVYCEPEKRNKKESYAQFFIKKLLFEICIHNYPEIMDVLQGRLAFAHESLGELTL